MPNLKDETSMGVEHQEKRHLLITVLSLPPLGMAATTALQREADDGRCQYKMRF